MYTIKRAHIWFYLADMLTFDSIQHLLTPGLCSAVNLQSAASLVRLEFKFHNWRRRPLAPPSAFVRRRGCPNACFRMT